MKTTIRSFYTSFLWFIAIALTLLGLGFATMQTSHFQQYLVHTLIQKAKNLGIELQVEDFSGIAPFKWSIKKMTISWDEKTCYMEDVHLRLGILSLLQKELSINFLEVAYANFSYASTSTDWDPRELSSFSLPFRISARTVSIDHLLLHNTTTEQELALHIEGSMRSHRGLEEMTAHLLIKQLHTTNLLQVNLLSSRRQREVAGQIQLEIEENANLFTFLNLPARTNVQLSFQCHGPWEFWRHLKSRSTGSPLEFSLEAKATDLQIPSFPLLRDEWNLKTKIALWPDLSSSCENCLLKGPWIDFFGKLSLSPHLHPTYASAIITIKDLSPLSSVTPVPIEGTGKIKLGLNHDAFLCSLESSKLQIGKQHFETATCKMEAFIQENQWQGHFSGSLENALLPWQGELHFLTTGDLLKITDITFSAGPAQISGYVTAYIQDLSCGGTVFLNATDLRPFRSLFPSSDLEGKLGGDLSFFYGSGSLDIQSHLLCKNIRYQSSLVDTIQIESDMQDVLQNPYGSLSLECSHLSTKEVDLEKLSLSSTSTDTPWQSFSIDLIGDWKQELSLHATGTWKKEPRDLQIECTSLKGMLLSLPFLADPFTVSYSDDHLSLKNARVSLGSGILSSYIELTKEQSLLEIEGKELPMKVISLFYPTLDLVGSTSFQGEFHGETSGSQGSLLWTLNELQFGQMQAKGSLQCHFNSHSAQMFGHIYATEGQFLDWTATIPLTYSFFPLKITPDNTRPVFGELTTQGALEEIFNFLQTASQKAFGWVTGHVLLSDTLDAPKLLGELTILNGSYENYLFGLKLRDIQATILAKGDSLFCKECTAIDPEKGRVSASGTLSLHKSQNFPYTTQVDVNNLQIIHSDSLLASATGIASIAGDSREMKITGPLQADAVTFKISEDLLIDIPVLPFTYINKPICLQRSEIFLSTGYPVRLELDITSDATVRIQGKGLDSYWKGSVLLTGTVNNPIGKGTLTLEQGEFKFSGKTFTLTQGDLSFSDKANQNSYLHITGQLQMDGVTIIANMQGPLNGPALTFQSNPPLPTSSILALILFNKDISEISPMQTLQLAQVIMSLTGSGGPDVLSAIRKTLGVDKLSISRKDGTDELAVEIGWYLAHGITVSLSQSATSSDVTVEVDLKHGFVFEAETQNQEEGKFSLKWNRNY